MMSVLRHPFLVLVAALCGGYNGALLSTTEAAVMINVGGDECGTAGVHCAALKCACSLCPDGVNHYGCCDGKCYYDDHFKCVAQKPESTCPPLAVGDECGTPPQDCADRKCACERCPDGINHYGCCGTCHIDDDGKTCSADKPESSCPSIPVGAKCGTTTQTSPLDCADLRCPCRLCPEGKRQHYGCCGDCHMNRDYLGRTSCREYKPPSTCPTGVGKVCGTLSKDCAELKGCTCSYCPDKKTRYGCCGECYTADDGTRCSAYKPSSTCPNKY